MRLYRSNHLEQLALSLGGELSSQPLRDPFAAELLVVQSQGMADWVGLELADQLGLAAHLEALRPRQLVERLFRSVLGDASLRLDAWSRDKVAWVLVELLPEVAATEVGLPLQRWLGDEPDLSRLYPLARRVAYVFDQYVVYRYDMVSGWERGEGEGWQPALWRRLVQRLEGGHLVHLAQRFFTAAESGLRPARMPARLSLFGISTLPPLYLQVLAAVDGWTEVSMYQLAPSREFWADVRSPREIQLSLFGREPEFGDEAEAAHHLTQGNPLLARLGRVGRELQQSLEGWLDYEDDGLDRFVEPEGHGVLATLQADMLAVQHRGRDLPAQVIAAGDHSLTVHGCHAPVREVEVLRDQLLELLHRDPSLRPRDIVVMMPDLSVHGPLVEAVFGVERSDPTWLPYTLADRSLRQVNLVARALLALLELVGSRMRVGAVLDLLVHEPIRERFGLDEGQVEGLRTLVREAGVRWGLDAAHREAEGQPPYEANTWRFGLDRIVLGYALSAEQGFRGIVGLPDLEGGLIGVAERVAELHEELVASLMKLQRPRTLGAWRDDLSGLVTRLLDPAGRRFEEVQAVRSQLEVLARDAEAARYHGQVPLEVVRDLLEAALGDERQPGAFLRRGITFCEMLPMRAIPFRVVGLLGLSDGAFPRTDAKLGFDLIAASPRPGDRSKRYDDRYLVLEALLSSRDAVVVTYVSRSVKDNAVRPPSVVLAELLDVLDEGFITAEGEPARAHVVVEHPLQPFSPRYRPEPPSRRLFTYDATAAGGAEALQAVTERQPFLLRPLHTGELESVDVDELARFLRDAPRWFLRQRLGVSPPSDVTAESDREPWTLDPLERYAVGTAMLELRLQGLSAADTRAVLAGKGLLPLGELASCSLGRLVPVVEAIVAEAAPRLWEVEPVPRPLEVSIAGLQVTAEIDGLTASGRVEVGWRDVGRKAGRDLLGAWLRHLMLDVAGLGRPTEVFGRKGLDGAARARLRPTAGQGGLLLAELVELYKRGQEVPLPLHAEAAWKVRPAAVPDLDPARSVLEQQWRFDATSGEAWQQLLGGIDALVTPPAHLDLPRFTELALTLAAPLRLHLVRT